MINEAVIRPRRKVVGFLWLSALCLIVGGLALSTWSVKRRLAAGFHFRMTGMVAINSHVTKLELSAELERDGLSIAHFGDVFEWHDILYVSQQRRLVLLVIEAKGDTPAADLLYTLYDANNMPLASGKLQAVSDGDDVVSATKNVMLDDKKQYVVYGPRGQVRWRATHVIIDDHIPAATRGVIHR